MGRWSYCCSDVHLKKLDQVQTLYYYKYRGKLGRQNVSTQAGAIFNIGVNKIIVYLVNQPSFASLKLPYTQPQQ